VEKKKSVIDGKYLVIDGHDLPGDEVEECEGMCASILTPSTQRNELYETGSWARGYVSQETLGGSAMQVGDLLFYIAYLSNEYGSR
jgi:hypothetical protein